MTGLGTRQHGPDYLGAWKRLGSMRLMGAMTWHAYAQLNPCPRVESKMPDYLENYQRKIKEDDKKDDKPIQGMINTI